MQLGKAQIELRLTNTLIVVIFIKVVIFVAAIVLNQATLGEGAFLG